MKHIFITILLLSVSLTEINASETYQNQADFLKENFSEGIPKPEVIWLKSKVKKQIEDILNHKYKSLRVRYWKKSDRSVWVLEEIGKTKPITVGIVIDNDKISKIKVLIFRESRGWEVKHPFFTKQFIDAKLTHRNRLTKQIDGISGATLSVRALTKLARIALLLNKQINHDSKQ
jgi:FMN-binding domain